MEWTCHGHDEFFISRVDVAPVTGIHCNMWMITIISVYQKYDTVLTVRSEWH